MPSARSRSPRTPGGSGPTAVPCSRRGPARADRPGRRPVRDLHRARQRRRQRAVLPVQAPLPRLPYFRTDPSYQPELRAYLGQLLADAERFAAAAPELAEWARASAAPSPEEIETLRRLILANEEVLAGLGEHDRQRVEDAITTARRSRAALDATFPAQFRGLARQATPSLFPAIERSTRTQARHG